MQPTAVDSDKVQSRVNGPQAADELAELYITESARIRDEHGFPAAEAFLERLRDNLISICPVKSKPVEPEQTAYRDLPGGRDWEGRIEDGYELALLDAYAVRDTEKAWLFKGEDELWIPKSVLGDGIEEGQHIGRWPVKEWFVEKELS